MKSENFNLDRALMFLLREEFNRQYVLTGRITAPDSEGYEQAFKDWLISEDFLYDARKN